MIDPTRLVRPARVLTLVCVGAALLWFVWRFDRIRLPEDGVSPLLEVEPGATLIVDRHPRAAQAGDLLLYRGAAGELLLGKVREAPADAAPGVGRALAEGALWIEGDEPGLAHLDSRGLGPLAPERIEGRVFLIFGP